MSQWLKIPRQIRADVLPPPPPPPPSSVQSRRDGGAGEWSLSALRGATGFGVADTARTACIVAVAIQRIARQSANSSRDSFAGKITSPQRSARSRSKSTLVDYDLRAPL